MTPSLGSERPALIPATSCEDWIINQALGLLEQRLFQRGPSLRGPDDVRQFLRLKLAGEAHEVFAVVFLDAQHRVIAYEPLFNGTIHSTAVYPRVVLKRALEFNASSLVLAHNHPSGVTEPSRADEAITTRLTTLLAEIDIRVLDHLIVGEGKAYSFAEAGRL